MEPARRYESSLHLSRQVRAWLIAQGRVAQGYGDDGVALCVPHRYYSRLDILSP
jgi:hypothetical protein